MKIRLNLPAALLWIVCVMLSCLPLSAKEAAYNVDGLTFDGSKGSITIQALISDPAADETEEQLIYSLHADATLVVQQASLVQTTVLTAEVKHGKLEVIELAVTGTLPIERVSGDGVKSWSLERPALADDGEGRGLRLLVELKEPIEAGTFVCTVTAHQREASAPGQLTALFFTPPDADLLTGSMLVSTAVGLRVVPSETQGLRAIESIGPRTLSYAFNGGGQSLSLNVEPLMHPNVTFDDFELAGEFMDGRFSFVMTGVLNVLNAGDYKLPLLAGNAAFSAAPVVEGAKVLFERNQYYVHVEEPGEYPTRLEFDARVATHAGRSVVSFDMIDSALQPIRVTGLPVVADQVRLNGVPTKADGDALTGNLAGNGKLSLVWTDPSWKRPEAVEAALFYSVESVSQLAVGPGLIRQVSDYQVQVMQGTLRNLVFDLEGVGEITQVTSDSILRWQVLPNPEDAALQQLVLELNKDYTGDFSIRVQSQYAMDAFPTQADPLRVVPQGAIRYSGYIRIVNVGAVSIDVPKAQGFAQISPEYFPAQNTVVEGSGQVLAYRFSDVNFDYTVQAENILPEVSVSQLLMYHVGLEDQSLRAELELTIREAPLRDFFIQIPEGYSLSDLKAPKLADYFVLENAEGGNQLRLVFSQPISGRQVIELELEDNRKLTAGSWTLPSFQAQDVKNVRGHVGVSVDPGLRASVQSIEGLSEQAPNFFPKTVANLQVALRLREVDWAATLEVEQLPQAIQADALHLYSVGEGRIYGSSVMNFIISGAPVSEFKIQVPESMHNLDFVGRDVRGWSPLGEGLYVVELHTPASGAYTLLATYESQFESQGERVAFAGVAPQGVASEQGYVVVVSNFPFALNAVESSAGLLRLEPNEIPSEFRLLYDSKVLAAFQYTARPMQVELELKSFAQAAGMDQVIDFAELKTQISRDGEILTAVDLMLKSKGQTHFRMQVPEGHRIWSALVAGEKVSPISVADAILLPLPAGQDPNRAVPVKLELASKADNAEKLVITAPALFAPSLIVNWQLDSDPGYGLRYQGGDISSAQLSPATDGFSWLRGVLAGERRHQRVALLLLLLSGSVGIFAARLFVCGSGQHGLFSRLFKIFLLVGSLLALVFFGMVLSNNSPHSSGLQNSITLRTPIELSSQPLSLEVENRSYDETEVGVFALWPAVIGVALWCTAMMTDKRRQLLLSAGWLCVFLGALSGFAGAELFIACLILFFVVHVMRPFCAKYLFGGVVQASVLLALGCLAFTPSSHLEARTLQLPEPAVAQELTQSIEVQDDIAHVAADLTWVAAAGERYIFLRAPATLLEMSKLPEGLRLSKVNVSSQVNYQLEAETEGSYTLSYRYRVPVVLQQDGQSKVQLPTGLVLSNQASIQLPNTNVTLESEQAVTVQSIKAPKGAMQFKVVFKPASEVSLAWQPERRDSSQEAAVYHAESYDLFTPLSGLMSGYHRYRVRLAQGQLDSLKLKVPEEMTITAVQAKHMVNWQFDPDARELMLYFQPVQLSEFEVAVFSQYASGELPYRRAVESPRVIGAASQLGLVALATDEEVQVGEVDPQGATTLNLEDFPAAYAQQLAHLGRVPVVRRAYRWSAESGSLGVQALAVLPDVRVTSQQTLSLGEDRILLRAELQAQINRAGVFKLSLPLPADYDVESVSGQQLSHWNESTGADGARSLQLHLKGKTQGAVVLNVGLSGPGLGDQASFTPSILQLEGAGRHSGTLALVPELGYRLNPTERVAAIQMDPAAAGMSRQKMMLFRILNENAQLVFDVERVDPWVEVERVQSVAIRSGMVDVKARFNFLVENAGIREQRFRLPEGALGVQFSGDAVADHQEDVSSEWTVKLNQKMVGAFVVELSYQIPTPDQPDQLTVQAVEALGVNQQSGYLTLLPRGRLQLVPQMQGDALQKAEAQMIAAKLRGDLKVDEASHVYRLLRPDVSLLLDVKRHEVVELVPAQVRDVKLTSVLSGKGAMLTKVALQLDPGDKRMLRISLPPESEFWFGFLNQQSAWPWREGSDILLQLEANSVAGADVSVEFFYSTQSVIEDRRDLRASLRGPQLDLPLENISWSLFYPETWTVEEWEGNMTQAQVDVRRARVTDLSSYMQLEQQNRMVQKRKAEGYLTTANNLRELGKQQEARQAFSSAYNLSQFDDALNEDARVQLKNVREEQALVALANRRNVFMNDNRGVVQANEQIAIDESQLMNYTDKMVKDVLRGNSEEENNTLRLLAARLIDQQQAVPVSPMSIQTVLPQQGNVATFTRSLQINDQADLIIELRGERTASRRSGGNLMVVLLLAVLIFGVSIVSRTGVKA
ncbi:MULTISPECIES: hypothetical protein [unclassified Lentimonas]|uniref:hypothetical protein n=1 Tax=unclassified Lentimonas TaxID=2630993 RepID=UPI001326F891|nr:MULTISPECIES: hypothetical protein [unclassified Lentimonas]CAA6692312.1 Unannotated [Lentimonas sp. CC10]CAA6694646.1 Unannotated [Lentimonas sp. CC19]CAA7071395.1 Unannotated [Lentimonas sp. CC11]